MSAAGGDSKATAPSKPLLDVRRCVAGFVAASAEEALAQPTQDAAQITAAVAVGGLSGFVSALQLWTDNPDVAPLEEYSQVPDHEPTQQPRFELGEATLDVLLEFYEMSKTIIHLWRGRPPAVTGTLLPLLFKFFGFYRAAFITSRKQLYLRVMRLKNELEKLSPGARETHLHSFCFETAPMRRRTALSTASSSDGDLQQKADCDALKQERRRLERAMTNMADRQCSLEAAQEVLTNDREEQQQRIDEQHKMDLQGHSLRTAELEEQLSQRDMDLDETLSKLQDLDYEKSCLVLTTTTLQAQVMLIEL
jgi:hypothetical protein